MVGATSGNEGIQQAQALKPFAITLDVMMPVKDGWQVLHDLKANPATAQIPVVLLTVVDKKALGYRLGAADYLLKPLNETAVIEALQRLTHANGGVPPRRLLVVDDDPQVADLVTQLLRDEGYLITAAADGLAALDAIGRERPDVILLDLMMPRLDGFGVLERLHDNRAWGNIPVIILTAKLLTAAEAAALRRSAVQIIEKQGLESEVLLRELARALA